MSVYIPNMEMPTRCGLCPMFCDDFNDYCSAAQRSIPFDAEKPEWCPLVPLPEGHGRLIDADALQEEFKKSHDGKRLMLIDTAPTIVPAEGSVNDGT